ncbi:MAG: hypothetical protein ABJL72_04095 [Roseobacter sp.]
MRLTSLVATSFLCLFIANPAAAERRKVEGQTAPQFSLAVEEWLEGKDLLALESLAKLSREGNIAAQILLASIATRGNMHAHVTADLPRKERIALLRIPKGLSGKSWLTEAEGKEPLATALLQSTKVGEKAAAIVALIELGEIQTALIAARSVNSTNEAIELTDALIGIEDQLPDEAASVLIHLLNLAYSDEYGRYTGSARIPQRLAQNGSLNVSELAWFSPGPRELLDSKERLAEVVKLSGQVESWTPMYEFCHKKCTSSAGECTVVGMTLLWSVGPFGLRSPVQSLLPNRLYWSSARIEGDLARSAPDIGRYFSDGDTDGVAKINACFIDAMKASQETHGYGG